MTVREEAQRQLDNLRADQTRCRADMLALIGELADLAEGEHERGEQIRRTETWIERHDAWVAAGRPPGPRHETGRPEPWSQR